MSMCSYCFNLSRLPSIGIIVPNDAQYFDCPVCQENRIDMQLMVIDNDIPEPTVEDIDAVEEDLIISEDLDVDIDDQDYYDEDD